MLSEERVCVVVLSSQPGAGTGRGVLPGMGVKWALAPRARDSCATVPMWAV